MTPAVSLDRVTRRFHAAVAVRDLSLEIARGEMFGLIGPDGAGKTTTIRLVCGLLAPDSGSISVFGHNPRRDRQSVTRAVGYLSQRFSLYGDLSIDENIAFSAEIHGVTDYRVRRERLLDVTQLKPFRSRPADQLSGGMKQKLALACTLVHEPDLLLLDEPTTGVDPVSRREFWKLLGEFLSQRITIVMATPYLDEAERCTRVALLHNGSLLALDTPGHLRSTMSQVLIEVVAEPHRKAAAVLAGLHIVADVQTFGDRAHVRTSTADAEEAARSIRNALVQAGLTVLGVRPIRATLEDIFIDKVTHP